VPQPSTIVVLCIGVCYLKAKPYLGFVLLVDIECHHNKHMKTVEGRVSRELEEEFVIVFAYRTSNPSIKTSLAGV
jgi:hypothetical protein